MRKRPLVVRHGAGPQLRSTRSHPLAREYVEGWNLGGLRRNSWRVRLPNPAFYISQNMPQFGLGPRTAPTVLGPAERHETALAIGMEAQRPRAPLAIRWKHLPRRSARHQAATPRAALRSSMSP